MKKFYPQFTATNLVAAIVFFIMLNQPLFAQPGQPSHEGVIRIKVSEALATELRDRKFSKTQTGVILTGVPGLDNLNRKFKVNRFTRVFRDAGKNEERHRRHGLHLWYEVRMDKGSSVADAVRSFRSDKQVLKAEPVYKKTMNGSANMSFGPVIMDLNEEVSPPILPDGSNDPLLTNQWHYHNTGQSGGTQGADIRLLDAWKIETGNKEVIVAITDGGIQSDHPDLAANMWRNEGEIAANNIDDDNNGFIDDLHGYSFVNNSGNIYPDYHGTHVAGTIGAASNNGVGVAGVAGGSGNGDGIRLMSCAVFSDYSDPGGFAESYVYAADNGAVISQNSWGYTIPGLYEQAVLDAIDYFIAEAGKDASGNQTGPMKGGIVIFAAGNSDSEDNYYPGFYEPVFAVAATTHRDTKAIYSNYGAWVDIAAPGGETYERDEEGVLSTLADSQYGSFMGTSMACPHVSGVAALVLSKYGGPDFGPAALRERLRHSIDNIDALNAGYSGKLGLGRINAALALAENDTEPPERVDDLAVEGKDVGEITLTWTSPHDESGFVSAYDIRYSTSPITAANFTNAIRVSDVPSPKPSGTPETFTVKNLKGGIVYYFALRSIDFEGNISPISNVVSETGALTPVIAVSPASITENLETAETSTRTFTISNNGGGPLRFTLREVEDKDFVSLSPLDGEVAPGAEQVITVSFDANGLFAGSYQAEIVIENNDPERNTVTLRIILEVTNNNAPIASIEPAQVDFISAQRGSSVRRPLTVSNKGSDPLIITNITSTNEAFGADFSVGTEIAPFAESVLYLTFSPQSTGLITGEVSLHTNDPTNEIFTIQVKGEGLNAPPVVASPDSFEEVLEENSSVNRTLTLQNNGSRDRRFRIEVRDTEVVSQTQLTISSDSIGSRQKRLLDNHRKALAQKSSEINALLNPIGGENRSVATGTDQLGATVAAADDLLHYTTGFEEFNAGPLSGQHNWFATQGWTIAGDNPDDGGKHFRGTSIASGPGEKYAVSPMVPYGESEIPRYTSMSMRLNLDNAAGEEWQVITQEQYYISNRVRFNPDGSIDTWVIDNDYNMHWIRLPIETPSGYFDLAIEYNNWGSDTSGFPTYHLFINNQYVFSGTGIGFGIAQVAVMSTMENPGPTLDMDNLKIIGGEYLPHFIRPSPMEGVIPAGGSAHVSVSISAKGMKFGDYKSDMVVHLDETDSLTIPAALSIPGEAGMVIYPHAHVFMEALGTVTPAQLTLMNTGGKPVQFNFQYDLPGLVIEPREGTLDVRENRAITFSFEGPPGIYREQVKLHTDMEHRPVEDVFVEIRILTEGSIFVVPAEQHFEITAGEVSTRTIQVRNDGENTVSFEASLPFGIPWLSLDPAAATIADQPVDIIMTFDGRELSPGLKSSWINFFTNDVSERYYRMEFTVNVLPDTAGTGKITREVWEGVTGNTIGDIPLDQNPSDSTVLTLFESPANTGDQYGSRIRGYVITPYSGWYTFWIASNDHSELWLSGNEDAQYKEKIASVTGYTNSRQWDKYASQQSQEIYLEGDQKYYIEALHKEGVGSDHLAVGWQLPEGTLERPIPGLRLAPYGLQDNNKLPRASLPTLTDGQTFTAPATINIEVDAVDEDGSIAKVEFYSGTTKLGIDVSAPYAYTWKNVPAGNYFIWAIATDNLGGYDTHGVNVVVTEGQSCAAAGSMIREQWNGISGTLISSIPVNTEPSLTERVTIFESPSNIGDNYGIRIRGFLCVPADGDYTFWIASNDKSELWLSTDASPANKVKVAYVSGYTDVRQWTKYPTQQSAKIQLMGGQQYYIEALHKEGVGTDHLAVGWQLPDGTLERPIPGMRLLPFEFTDNGPPAVTITSPASGQSFSAPATVEIIAEASDADGTVEKVEFFNGTTKLGDDIDAPYSYTWSGVTSGNYGLKAVATDNEGAVTTSAIVNINVTATCAASGTITREFWTDIPGAQVSDIPLNTSPDGSMALTIFEGPVNAGTQYGARISGYLCPPSTGDYYFWIASNDHSELWLSTGEDPANKVKIAYVSGATGVREWSKYPSQVSGAVRLTEGKAYYIEALHKQGVGADHIAVGWLLPDGTLERPISGTRLSPAGKGANASARGKFENEIASDHPESGAPMIMMYPNPVNGKTLTVALGSFLAPENTFSDIEIRQLTGLSVYSERIACRNGCSTEIDINERFTAGIYIVQIRIAGKTFTEKLVVH